MVQQQQQQQQQEIQEEPPLTAEANKLKVKQQDASSSSSSTYKLSSYGDPDQRRYPVVLSVAITFLIFFLFLLGTFMPILIVASTFLLYFNVIPQTAIVVLLTVACLDFAIPLPSGYHPNPKLKLFLDRVFAEGAQHYYPGRSIFLPTADQLPKDRAYILASWPHGLLGGGNHLGFYDFDIKAGIHPLFSGASIMRYVPITRRILFTLGMCDVTRAGLSRVLDCKKYGPTYPYNVVHLVVGGIPEMFYTPMSAKAEQIILRKRKGFIKLAIRTGADIIPLYSFGANQAYRRVLGPDSLLCRLSHVLRMSILVWFDRFWIPFSFVPVRTPVLSVVGNVFQVPKVEKEEDITDELVNQVHADFVRTIRALFDEYKVVYVNEMGADPSWLTRELKLEDELLE